MLRVENRDEDTSWKDTEKVKKGILSAFVDEVNFEGL